MAKSELIIFDCDGVLVDSETITNQVLVDYLNEFGAGLSLKEALELFQGGALSDSIEYMNQKHGITLPPEFTSNFRHRMKAAFEKRLKAVPGIVELIDSLIAANKKICIASNGPIEKMDTTLHITNLKKYFGDSVFSAYQINKWKPEPDLFLYAAEQMNTKPENCTVIEDSPRGIKAAKLAGMKAYGFDVYGKTEELKAEGAVLFTKMTDLIDKI